MLRADFNLLLPTVYMTSSELWLSVNEHLKCWKPQTNPSEMTDEFFTWWRKKIVSYLLHGSSNILDKIFKVRLMAYILSTSSWSNFMKPKAWKLCHRFVACCTCRELCPCWPRTPCGQKAVKYKQNNESIKQALFLLLCTNVRHRNVSPLSGWLTSKHQQSSFTDRIEP